MRGSVGIAGRRYVKEIPRIGGTLLAQFHVTWDIRSGKEQEYVEWMVDVYVPFWRKQPGLLAIRGFYTLVGSGPSLVGEFDFESLELLCAVLASDGYQQIRSKLETLVTGYESKILLPTGRGDLYVMPPAQQERSGLCAKPYSGV